MQVDSNVLPRIDLDKFTTDELEKPRDRFPPLIIESSLSGASKEIVKYINAAYGGGVKIPSEILTMPRGGFGPRPVLITDTSTRILYGALVNAFGNALPEPSRSSDKWKAYSRFGLDGPSDYVAIMDIASCYEYVDHRILREELALRSFDLILSSTVTRLLTEAQGAERGLPQMLPASDRLADVYLGILERRLGFDGYQMARYVDDMRLTADTWEAANVAIEQTAEYAREIGLILSSGKTGMYKKSTLIAQEKEEAMLSDKHNAFVWAFVSFLKVWNTGSYEGLDEARYEHEDTKAELHDSARSVVLNWWENFKERDLTSSGSAMEQRYLSQALFILRNAEESLPVKLLADMVFEDPRKIEHVVDYLVAPGRPASVTHNRDAIHLLAAMGRQSPWAKLWIMHAIESLDPTALLSDEGISRWVKLQLNDRHETVRAQAAWLCSIAGTLVSDDVSSLYNGHRQ